MSEKSKKSPWLRREARRVDCKYRVYRVGNLLWITGDFPAEEARRAGFTPAYNYPGSWLRQDESEPLPDFLHKRVSLSGDEFTLAGWIRQNYGRVRSVNPEDKERLQARGLLARDGSNASTVDQVAREAAEEGWIRDGYGETLLAALERNPGDVDYRAQAEGEFAKAEAYRDRRNGERIVYADQF